MTHRWPIHVYYEDTDLAGIVYYANYLKFIERARTEMVRELGIDQVALKAEGFVFAVRRVEADYIAPARFDDDLEVQTTIIGNTGARLMFQQNVVREGKILFSARVTVVGLNSSGRPARLPASIRQRFS